MFASLGPEHGRSGIPSSFRILDKVEHTEDGAVRIAQTQRCEVGTR